MYSYINDIDLPFDDTSETLVEMLENLAAEVPSAFVKVNHIYGSGGGWPQGEIIVKTEDLRSLFEFFGLEGSDVDEAIAATPALI